MLIKSIYVVVWSHGQDARERGGGPPPRDQTSHPLRLREPGVARLPPKRRQSAPALRRRRRRRIGSPVPGGTAGGIEAGLGDHGDHTDPGKRALLPGTA